MSQPKTPSRHRSRSEAKTPLTPSLINALNAASLSPTRPKQRSRSNSRKAAAGDTTNPFISKSRPVSPVKRTSGGIAVSESLSRQASGGVIRKGGVESRLDVVTRDYVPAPKPEMKRSKSTSSVRSLDQRDRFITNRDSGNDQDLSSALSQMSLHNSQNPSDNPSPGHTARLAAASGIALNRRVLSYHEAPPAASSSDPTMNLAREFARPLLHTRPGALPSSTGAITNKSRKIPTVPERVLDAPGMVDDFYLNLLSWSCENILAVALAENTYIWRADTGSVTQVGEAPEGSYVSSVDFSQDGAYLGVGIGSGEVELWDISTSQKLRTMAGHAGQIAALSWNQHILTSACGDGSIWHHDVRVPRHKVMELLGHSGEVCGLKWRSDGEALASGGNDNVVNIWDARLGDVGEGARGTPKWTKRNHTAAVKALAWCPWQPSLLASGGGTNDATIHIWNSTTGARLHSLQTPSQVTSLIFSPHRKEILSTHGYPTNSIMLHAYPSLERVAEIRDAHESRVLFSAVGPGGDVVCTGAGDENLKFWRVWEQPKETKKKSSGLAEKKGSTTSGILSIR